MGITPVFSLMKLQRLGKTPFLITHTIQYSLVNFTAS